MVTVNDDIGSLLHGSLLCYEAAFLFLALRIDFFLTSFFKVVSDPLLSLEPRVSKLSETDKHFGLFF